MRPTAVEDGHFKIIKKGGEEPVEKYEYMTSGGVEERERASNEEGCSRGFEVSSTGILKEKSK